MTETDHTHPKIVSRDEWRAARERLLEKEKAHTRARDALNAERRRLPMYRIDCGCVFDGPDGEAGLPELFAGRHQLILYHFMFGPNAHQGCDGCSMVVDNMCHAWAGTCPGTPPVRASSMSTSASGPRRRAARPAPGRRDVRPERVSAGRRRRCLPDLLSRPAGLEYLGSSFSYMDLTPCGRRESWEDSPAGWPQGAPYRWWRHHDKYDQP